MLNGPPATSGLEPNREHPRHVAPLANRKSIMDSNRLMATQMRIMRVQDRQRALRGRRRKCRFLQRGEVLRNIWAQGSAPYSDGRFNSDYQCEETMQSNQSYKLPGCRLILTSG